MKGNQTGVTQALIIASAFKTNWPLKIKAMFFKKDFEMGILSGCDH